MASTVLAVCGLVAAICIAIYQRNRNYGGRMSFAQGRHIDLLHDLIERADGLQININGKSVTGHLMFIRGFIANTGSRDIVEENFFDPLRISLPSGFVWRQVSLQSSIDVGQVHCEIENGSTISLKLSGLLKRGECLLINSLVEYLGDKDSRARIKVSHRIRDVDERINVHDLTDDFFEKRGFGNKARAGYFALVLFLIGGGMFQYQPLFNSSSLVKFVTADSVLRDEYLLRANVFGEIFAVDLRYGDRLDISPAKLFEENKMVPGVASRKELITYTLTLWLTYLLIVIFIIYQNCAIPWTERYRVRKSVNRFNRLKSEDLLEVKLLDRDSAGEPGTNGN